MADKCITLCADHLCLHNSCSGYYGVCARSALSVGARCGLTRDYVETCPKKEHIPKCIARGPGKIAVFDHGRAGNGKSTLDLERTLLQILKTDRSQRLAYSSDFGIEIEKAMRETSEEPVTFAGPVTGDEIVADLQRIKSAIEKFKAVPKPESTPWSPSEYERNFLGIWNIGEEGEEV